MSAILPLIVAFVCGLLMSLAKEGIEGKTTKYWCVTLANAVLIFSSTILATWYLQEHVKSLEPIHKFSLFLAVGVASSTLSDVIENTEDEIVSKKYTLRSLLELFKKSK